MSGELYEFKLLDNELTFSEALYEIYELVETWYNFDSQKVKQAMLLLRGVGNSQNNMTGIVAKHVSNFQSEYHLIFQLSGHPIIKFLCWGELPSKQELLDIIKINYFDCEEADIELWELTYEEK